MAGPDQQQQQQVQAHHDCKAMPGDPGLAGRPAKRRERGCREHVQPLGGTVLRGNRHARWACLHPGGGVWLVPGWWWWRRSLSGALPLADLAGVLPTDTGLPPTTRVGPAAGSAYLRCCFCEYTSKYFTRISWLLVTTKYFWGTSPPSLFRTLARFLSISSESAQGQKETLQDNGRGQASPRKFNSGKPAASGVTVLAPQHRTA